MRRSPISVLIPTRNEANNLRRCLEAVNGWAGEIIVIDSGSSDRTVEIAQSYQVRVVQFEYEGGWPKKRGWALKELQFENDWILLLDADEILTKPVRDEIAGAVSSSVFNGYRLRFEIIFLGRQLRYGNTALWKLSLFRRSKGRFERRLDAHDKSMSDIEIHEHIVVAGSVGELRNPVRHENTNSLDRYIQKHNEYSNWEARVFLEGNETEISATPFGGQAQRRRWLKARFLSMPGAAIAMFLYRYCCMLGFLDGKPGLLYCAFQAIQMFHIKAKVYEIVNNRALAASGESGKHSLSGRPNTALLEHE